MKLSVRLSFLIQLGNQRYEQVNDPVFIAWWGSSTFKPIIQVLLSYKPSILAFRLPTLDAGL